MADRPPLTRVVLAATSVADDLGYVAIYDVANILGSSTYRIIGGHMVTALVARWQLGTELYRETADTDLGVPPVVVREEGVIGRLIERGYERVEGNRFARPIDDVPAAVRGPDEGPSQLPRVRRARHDRGARPRACATARAGQTPHGAAPPQR